LTTGVQKVSDVLTNVQLNIAFMMCIRPSLHTTVLEDIDKRMLPHCQRVEENGEVNFFDILPSSSQSGMKDCVEKHKAKVMQSPRKSPRVPTCPPFGYLSDQLRNYMLM
jgi:hypothetical protein